MAITITRTPWQDDDGTGTTGTVLNNAVKTDLYNQIDAALAKAAQLAGGNTFTGAQVVTGNHTVSGVLSVGTASQISGNQFTLNVPPATVNAQFAMGANGAATNGIAIQNTNAANTILFLLFNNSAGAGAGSVSQSGATGVVYGTTSDARLKNDAGRAVDLAALRGVVVHDFTWKADGRRARGVFAQEAAAVFPAAIVEGADELTDDGSLARPWMTDYSKFVPDLIAGWQQHDAELADLRARLATITG